MIDTPELSSGGAATLGETSRPGVAAPAWQACVAALFDAVGCPIDPSAAGRPQSLARLLRGTGFAWRRLRRAELGLVAPGGVAGCLYQLRDGSWQALGLQAGEPVLLGPAGRTGQPGSPPPPEQVHRAWTLTLASSELRSMRPFLRRFGAQFTGLFLAAIVVNCFALLLPLFSSFVYDKILGNGIIETMWALVIGLALAVGLEFCVRVVRVGLAERFAVASEVEIDRATFRNLVDMPANRMPSLGALLEKYKQILSYRDFLSSSYLLSLADLPFLLLFLAAIAIEAGPLVLVAVVSGTLMVLVSVVFAPPVMAYERQSRVAGEQRFGLMNDVMVSREALVGNAIRERLAERWRQASATAIETASRARYWRGLSASVGVSLSSVSFVAVLVGGVYMIEAHTLTSGGLLAASMLTSRAMGMFGSAITLLLRYREFRAALRDLDQVLPAAAPAQTVPRQGRLQGAVRFDHVSCRVRSEGRPVLSDINLAIQPGEIVGIAGAPGSGKTTLLRLMAGVLSPDQGRVLIDNMPIARLAAADLGDTLGYKPQEYGLLSGTIEDNVRAGRPVMSAADRQDVLLRSGLARAFEEGALDWGSEVGPRGSQLSGGQRQLVAIARAMLGRPPLLVLDEPTNGFDAALEASFAQQIQQLRGQSTVVISTHSRSLLSICDRIIVVGQSRILADGPRERVLVG